MSQRDHLEGLIFQSPGSSWSDVPPPTSQPSSSAIYSPLPRTDVVVQVGDRHFHAHRSVLSAQSGYFKNVLDARVEVTASQASCSSRVIEGHTPTMFLAIPLPVSSTKSFATLLEFMYSAQLRLDAQNISEVLLCSQLLQMPQAIDICRSFLVRLQHLRVYTLPLFRPLPSSVTSPVLYPICSSLQPYATASALGPPAYGGSRDLATIQPTIVRPIPTNRMSAFFSPYPSLPQQQHLHSSVGTNIPSQFFTEDITISRNLTGYSPRPVSMQSRHTPRMATKEHSPGIDEPKQSNGSGQKQLIIGKESAPKPPRPQSTPSTSSPNSELVLSSETYPRAKPPSTDTSTGSEDDNSESSQKSSTSGHSGNRTNTSTSTKTLEKVIIDIACCDGPVKFQRVLNENCSLVCKKGQKGGMVAESSVKCQRKIISFDDISHCRERSIQSLGSSGKVPIKHTAVTTTEKQETLLQTDNNDKSENCKVGPILSAVSRNSSKGTPAATAYFCIYCKQTFKSHCCYLKHKWRHLNPLTLDGQSTCSWAGVTAAAKITVAHCRPQSSKVKTRRQRQAGPPNKDNNVSIDASASSKPLEINVPFYPCKLCGCKFPSYYFVHKHQRICHQKQKHLEDSRDECSNTTATAKDLDTMLDSDDTTSEPETDEQLTMD